MQSQNISQGFDRMAGWQKEQERILEQNVLKTRRSKIMDWWWLIQSVRSHDNLMEAVWKSDWNNHMSDISRFFFGRNPFDALANQNAWIGGDEGRSRFFRSWSNMITLFQNGEWPAWTPYWKLRCGGDKFKINQCGFWMVDSDQWWILTNGEPMVDSEINQCGFWWARTL